MKHKTRILTLRTISVLVLVALLAALSPPSLQTGSVALAQTGPTLTVTSAGPTSIQVSWTAVADADSYRLIRWNSGPNWDDVGGAHPTTSYTDTGLTTGTKYFYQVTAVTDSLEGPWSDRQNAIPGSLDAPALSATASIGQIDLSWTDVSGAVSYNLIFWTSGQASWDELGGGAIDGTSYPHTSLTNGAKYFYQVRAVNAANTRSDWSNQLSTTVPQPGRPSAPASVNAASRQRRGHAHLDRADQQRWLRHHQLPIPLRRNGRDIVGLDRSLAWPSPPRSAASPTARPTNLKYRP